MQYLLDSDAVSALSNGNSSIQKYFSSLGEEAIISLCILTIYEFEFSIASCSDKEKKSHIQGTLHSLKKNFSVLGLGFDDAKIYGELKKGLQEKTGINKNALKRHNIDIALASVAIAHDCVLVSKDKIYSEHLREINTGLIYEGWE